MLSQLSGASRLFPIIGDPVEYAQSPVNLTRTFAERGHNGLCVPLRVQDGDLDVVMAGLTASLNVDGILVTMPHKFTAFAFCTSSSERVRLLGVVSVIRRNPDRTWHGDMLDGLAFVKAQHDRGAEIDGARALLVGAGGAGSAIAIALLDAGVRDLVIHDAEQARVEGEGAILDHVRARFRRSEAAWIALADRAQHLEQLQLAERERKAGQQSA